MATTKRVTPGREGYKILFNDNTVIINHKFAAAASKYGTKENRIIRNIRHDFPGMTEVIVSGRECDSAKANTRLPYENMEKHIRATTMLMTFWQCLTRLRLFLRLVPALISMSAIGLRCSFPTIRKRLSSRMAG